MIRKASSRFSVKNALGVSKIGQYEKYPDLSSFVGKRKKATFEYIKEMAWRKLNGWEEKLLSQVGRKKFSKKKVARKILIKVVVHAIPTYTMSCFKLPLGLCSNIECLIRKFWWDQLRDDR